MCTPTILEGMSDHNNDNIPHNEDFRDGLISEPNFMETSTHLNNNNDSPDITQIFNYLRIENTNKLVIGHLNINSLRNKFESLKCIIKDKLDILILSETKLDDTFPKNQFLLDGYKHSFVLIKTQIQVALLSLSEKTFLVKCYQIQSGLTNWKAFF